MENQLDLKRIDAIIKEKSKLPVHEGEDKIVSLKEAVKTHIKPGMSLYFGYVHSRANGTAYEIARQFWGTKPEFELIA